MQYNDQRPQYRNVFLHQSSIPRTHLLKHLHKMEIRKKCDCDDLSSSTSYCTMIVYTYFDLNTILPSRQLDKNRARKAQLLDIERFEDA